MFDFILFHVQKNCRILVRMSTWRGSSPKVSRRGVVVSTKLVEPSVPGASWTTSPESWILDDVSKNLSAIAQSLKVRDSTEVKPSFKAKYYPLVLCRQKTHKTPCDLDHWPMNLIFNRVLDAVKVSVHAKCHQAKCSSSWVIEVTQKNPSDDAENNTAVASAGSDETQKCFMAAKTPWLIRLVQQNVLQVGRNVKLTKRTIFPDKFFSLTIPVCFGRFHDIPLTAVSNGKHSLVFSAFPDKRHARTTCREVFVSQQDGQESDQSSQVQHPNHLATTKSHRKKHGSCPFVKIKFKDFSRTFKDHTKDIYGELN